ncbi:hypothetical protein ACJ41O_014820 [Fusarium nematophilum]
MARLSAMIRRASRQPFADELQRKLVDSLNISMGCGMIQGLPPLAPCTPIHRESHDSSLGPFDSLPAELLFLILNSLDLQSLSRFSRICLNAKLSVEALPAYAELLQHASQILVALTKTRLIRHHSAELLRQTLRSSRCSSCFAFAAFLFLPTCERACFECLDMNCALRVMTVRNAKECFHLTEDHLTRIPIMHSIPGEYQIRTWISRRRVFRLVSLKHVRQLALEVHGSAEKVAEFKPQHPPPSMRDYHKISSFRRFHEAQMEPPGVDLLRVPSAAVVPKDDFGGVASMHMGCLGKDGVVDSGQICRGCALLQSLCTSGQLPVRYLMQFGPRGVDVSRALLAQSSRMYSKECFAGHVKSCFGARAFPQSWGQHRVEHDNI